MIVDWENLIENIVNAPESELQYEMIEAALAASITLSDEECDWDNVEDED